MKRLQLHCGAVIIGDSFNNTLGLIRSLGEARVDITLLLVGETDRLYVSKSRYLKRSQVFLVPTIDDCMPVLQKIAESRTRQIIICTNDRAAQYIDAHEAYLHSCFITPMRGKQLGTLMNKDEQCRLAKESGMTVPQSFVYDRKDIFPDVTYPLLMKPLNSTGGEKSDIHICRTREEVDKAFNEVSSCSRFVVQEYIRKEYEINLTGVNTPHGTYVPGGIKKIRHYPNIYSPCSFGLFQSVEKLNIDITPILTFFQKVDYQGPFSVEFLHKEGKNYFMEVNFRHDGLAYAATASGVNLPALLFKKPTRPMTVKDTYMMDLSSDYCHVKDGVLSRKRWFSDFIKTGCQLNFNRRDPMPTIYYYLNKLKHRLTK